MTDYRYVCMQQVFAVKVLDITISILVYNDNMAFMHCYALLCLPSSYKQNNKRCIARGGDVKNPVLVCLVLK